LTKPTVPIVGQAGVKLQMFVSASKRFLAALTENDRLLDAEKFIP
jgi:hypothetical protein